MKDDKMIWAELIHLGMNFWGDVTREKCPFQWMETPEAAEGVREQYCSADHLRFDEDFWKNEVCPELMKGGVNTIVFDLGEGVVYPSHPELAVKGSWSADKLKAEVRRLKALGLEVFPKLNFSSSHDIWLKEYHKMLGTPEYYRVCKDVIRDAIEIFDHPRFVHLGLDEETATFQAFHTHVCVRQGELWWHDILMLIDEVEKGGARAWVWSDYIRRHPLEEFTARMPKTVVQNPWTYSYTHYQESKVSLDPSEDKTIKVMFDLVESGYDVIPCGSNCYGYKTNLEDLVRLFRNHPKRDRIKGFFYAPWLKTDRVFARRFRENGEQVANAIRLWNGTDHKMPWRGICAHRGDAAACPENTVPAFVSAAKKGAAMVEFDVKRCKTGELVIMHDGDVARTTNGKGLVSEMTFAEIRALDAGVRKGAAFAGTKVPTFDEAIDCLPKDGLWINVHCGAGVVDEVAAKIREKGRLHQAFVTAPLKAILAARQKVPELIGCNSTRPPWSRAWTDEELVKYVADSIDGDCIFIQPVDKLAKLTPRHVAKFHGWRGSVNWSVSNEPEKAKEIFASGADFILTDRLDDFLKVAGPKLV